MNARATHRGLPAVALWGGVGALAWAALTVLTGGGSAHADEQHDPSLLNGVSSLVTGTVSTVGETVTAVTQPVVTQVVAPVVTQVVAPVVTQVVAPVQQAAPPVVETVTDTVAQLPVVGPVTAPVVETVTDTAAAVVEPVTDLLQDAPVSQVVDPIRDAVNALPVVGDLLQDLGVLPLVDSVVEVVDETTGIVGGVVENTVPPVLTALDPTVTLPPVLASDPGFLATPGSTEVAPASATPAIVAPASSDRRVLSASSPLSAPAAPETTAPAADDTQAPPAAPIGGPAGPAAPVVPSSSAASGGASVLSHARISDVGIPALRAVERTSGASDDVLPTSLVADTDVSPD